ncbi:MAG: hypothetical protein QOJ66_3184, partial [Ilumatobacteraceae bacterium]
MISHRTAIIRTTRVDGPTLVTDGNLNVSTIVDRDCYFDIAGAMHQGVVEEDLNTLRQRARRHVGLHGVRCDKGKPAPGALELRSNGTSMAAHEGGHIDAGARRH